MRGLATTGVPGRAGLPADLALIPPGPRLSTILAGVDMSSLDDRDLIRYAQARRRQLAHEDARLLLVLREVGRRGDAASGGDPDRRWGGYEVACAMTWTANAADAQLALAGDVVERLPVVFAALDLGEIDHAKARVMSDWTSGLDTPTARDVIDKVIGDAPRLTTGQLRALLARLVFAADPGARAERFRRALTGRRVEARATGDGLADLNGFDLPPHRAVAAMERVDAIARAAKRAGDRRTMPQPADPTSPPSADRTTPGNTYPAPTSSNSTTASLPGGPHSASASPHTHPHSSTTRRDQATRGHP